MVAVPKKANDAMHLSLVEGLPSDAQGGALGEVLLQDSFLTWESRGLVRKGRERRAFLFEMHLMLTKEIKDSHGKAKYIYKNRLMVRLFFLNFKQEIKILFRCRLLF
jgi:hypothetical protein